MGHFPQLRAVLVALIASVLIAGLVWGECAACGIGVAAAPQSGGCCTPDGRCKSSQNHTPPQRCLKAHSSDAALLEQPAQIHQAADYALPLDAAVVEPRLQSEELNVVLAEYSPPDPYVLHHSLLI
jgi:hypothetical protein